VSGADANPATVSITGVVIPPAVCANLAKFSDGVQDAVTLKCVTEAGGSRADLCKNITQFSSVRQLLNVTACTKTSITFDFTASVSDNGSRKRTVHAILQNGAATQLVADSMSDPDTSSAAGAEPDSSSQSSAGVVSASLLALAFPLIVCLF